MDLLTECSLRISHDVECVNASPAEPMPAFVGFAHGPVLTLLFADAEVQHSTLARIEAFYESASAGTYLTCAEAAQARICRGYEAFNFPVDALKRWLETMKAVSPAAPEDAPCWSSECNEDENALLRYIEDNGVLEQYKYVVSALISQAETSLAHERLHALYALSENYRTFVHHLWNDLPRSSAAAIALDLKMRGYSEAVWPDEFGAYLGVRVPTSRRTEPTLEFGNKNAEACREARTQLLAEIPTYWKDDVGVEEGAFVLSSAQLDEARAVIPPRKKEVLPTKKSNKKHR